MYYSPPLVVRNHSSDLGLLKHDLGDPDLDGREWEGRTTADAEAEAEEEAGEEWSSVLVRCSYRGEAGERPRDPPTLPRMHAELSLPRSAPSAPHPSDRSSTAGCLASRTRRARESGGLG